MKKIIENIKKYIQYRKNRRYVKMKMLEYKVATLEFINGLIEENKDHKIIDFSNIAELTKILSNGITK